MKNNLLWKQEEKKAREMAEKMGMGDQEEFIMEKAIEYYEIMKENQENMAREAQWNPNLK